MEKVHRYRHSGIAVDSALALPEWERFARDDAQSPGAVIRLPETPPPAFAPDHEMTGGRDAVRFAIPGIGGWEIVGGREIRLFPDAGADPCELRLFTLGSAWAALGYQRGFAMWHGSAVAHGGKTVLICGSAGAGKSTLAAAMIDRGGALVADDLSRIQLQENGAAIYPSSGSVKLWGEAVASLGWEDRVIRRDWLREDKFHCAVTKLAAPEAAVRLDAIVVLEQAEETSLTRLEGAQALTATMSGTIYRPAFLDIARGWTVQGALAAGIVSGTRVYRLSRPRDLSTIGGSVELVLQALAGSA